VTLPTPDPTRRNEHSRRAILAATISMVAELGYEKASIEGIARRAGVGKQTIYRWWPSKGAVVLEALEVSLGSVTAFPDTGDIVEDLRVQMTGVVELFGATEVGAVYRGFIAAAQSDRALSQAHIDQVIEPATVACRERLAKAQERGEMRKDIDIQAVIDMLWGAIYYRLLLHTDRLESRQVDDVLQIVFQGLRVVPGGS
jgi:AcrR family transcriptional regulator